MELCDGDLRTKLSESKKVNESQTMEYFLELLSGLLHLHNNNIIHRDLKPENIFIASGVIKIGDFGMSTVQKSGSSNDFHTKCAGTELYLAPEQYFSNYSNAVDIYALGIILLEMLNPQVQPRFNNNQATELKSMVHALKTIRYVPDHIWKKWPVASRVILDMTDPNPSRRPHPESISKRFLDTAPEPRSKSQAKAPEKNRATDKQP